MVLEGAQSAIRYIVLILISALGATLTVVQYIRGCRLENSKPQA